MPILICFLSPSGVGGSCQRHSDLPVNPVNIGLTTTILLPFVNTTTDDRNLRKTYDLTNTEECPKPREFLTTVPMSRGHRSAQTLVSKTFSPKGNQDSLEHKEKMRMDQNTLLWPGSEATLRSIWGAEERQQNDQSLPQHEPSCNNMSIKNDPLKYSRLT